MKIVFTGGGTGGHFYPVIAIAEAITDLVREERLVEPQLYYLSPTPFDQKALFENRITYVRVPAGKIRRYFSFQNLTDFFKTAYGTLVALVTLFTIYPDVVVGKGGFGSVPTIMAARILRIPVIIHESDSKPGRASLFAARYAVKIAVSFDSAANYFPKEVQNKIARTGTPIRKALSRVEKEGARQYLGLDADAPVVLILGGSQGSAKINETVLSDLPELVAVANVIHQTGPTNIHEAEGVAKVVLTNNPHANRYHPFDYLSEVALQRAAGAADLVVTRAGANTLAEISSWKKPSIVIPIPESISHDQRTNAYAYARTGAAIVIEEENLTPHLLVSEIKRLLADPLLSAQMGQKAEGFNDPDAARIIAKAVLAIGLAHES